MSTLTESSLPLDRYIPSRPIDSDRVVHSFGKREYVRDDELAAATPQDLYMDSLSQALWSQNPRDSKVLHYKQAAPVCTGSLNSIRVVGSQVHQQVGKVSSGRSRTIASVPEKILDAPDMLDDFYLNPIDWSADNVLAVALGNNLYLWNANSGTISHLLETSKTDPICSVSWIKQGTGYLAVGTSDNTVQLWDVQSSTKLREMNGHNDRVSSLSWNRHILSSGSRDGSIINHDVRIAQHQVSTLLGHTGEVCGLQWNPEGDVLASGANDNTVRLWNGSSMSTVTDSSMHTLAAHCAAVKAMAWSPRQRNLLATGGGTADRTIRFWSAASGACLNTVDTESQVCSLLWAKNSPELISSHGFSRNQLTVWNYPSMTRQAELLGHSQRVLHMAMSPDGTTVCSASGDETLRFWKVFETEEKSARSKKQVETDMKNRKIKTSRIR